MSLDDLYKEVILEHYRRPRNQGDIPNPDVSVDLKNPVCGDEITLDLRLDAGRVSDIKFHGKGCSISQASASMMTQSVQGKTTEDAIDLLGRFRGMMRGELEPEAADVGDLESLTGVRHFPVRIKCAMLAWEALSKGLEKAGVARNTQATGPVPE